VRCTLKPGPLDLFGAAQGGARSWSTQLRSAGRKRASPQLEDALSYLPRKGVVEYRRGQVIYDEQAQPNGLCLIIGGRVKVATRIEDGSQTVTVFSARNSSSTSSNIARTGGSASVNNGTATVNGLPSGGTVLVFTGKPTQVIACNTLLNIPVAAVSQSAAGQMAGPSPVPTAGTVAASGWMTKASTVFSAAPANGQTMLSWYPRRGSASVCLTLKTGAPDDVKTGETLLF